MIHPNKPLKTYTQKDWETYYSDPKHFAEVFADRDLLLAAPQLSTAQRLQLDCINDRISTLMQG
jgi:hypothetical protein